MLHGEKKHAFTIFEQIKQCHLQHTQLHRIRGLESSMSVLPLCRQSGAGVRPHVSHPLQPRHWPFRLNNEKEKKPLDCAGFVTGNHEISPPRSLFASKMNCMVMPTYNVHFSIDSPRCHACQFLFREEDNVVAGKLKERLHAHRLRDKDQAVMLLWISFANLVMISNLRYHRCPRTA